MPTERPPLTDRQLALLRWIGDGCPDGVWPDHSHKLSVGVLETRNLASVRRWYGKWGAVIQPDGKYYLEHGHYPPAAIPTPRVAAPSAETSDPGALSKPRHPPTKAPKVQKPKAVSASGRLIADIVAAGGALTLEDATFEARSSIEARVRFARRRNLIPPGKQIIVRHPGRDRIEVHLEDLPDWMSPRLKTIPVNEQLRSPHAAVVELRDSNRLLAIAGPARRRALRLLQSLVVAAEHRGHTVTSGTARTDTNQHRHGKPDHLIFHVQRHEIELRISQEMDRTAHLPTAKELDDKARYSWKAIPRHDFTPTERLKIALPGPFEQARSTWSDGTSRNLDVSLADILFEIELRADASERTRLLAIERQRQQELENERRVAKATERFIEAHRASVLDEQLTGWLRSRQMVEYLTAMELAMEGLRDPDDEAAGREWLSWARQHAESIDPLKRRVAMPADVRPSHMGLQPFMERPSSWL